MRRLYRFRKLCKNFRKSWRNGRRGQTPLWLTLQLLSARPAGVLDPLAAMGAFEDVVDDKRATTGPTVIR